MAKATAISTSHWLIGRKSNNIIYIKQFYKYKVEFYYSSSVALFLEL